MILYYFPSCCLLRNRRRPIYFHMVSNRLYWNHSCHFRSQIFINITFNFSLQWMSIHTLHTMNLLLISSTLEHYKALHPKLRNINPHNVTHSLISQNPRERMSIVQISLLIVTFLSLISQNISLMQNVKEVNPHPRNAPYVNMWSVIFFFFFFCHLLNVGACVCHIPWESQVKWTTLA